VGCPYATVVLAWKWAIGRVPYEDAQSVAGCLCCHISPFFFSAPFLYVIDKSAVLRDRTGNI